MARKRSTSPAEEPAAEALPALPTAIELPPAAATRHDLVDPTVPAGLVRISNGSGERFIWNPRRRRNRVGSHLGAGDQRHRRGAAARRPAAVSSGQRLLHSCGGSCWISRCTAASSGGRSLSTVRQTRLRLTLR